jgi:chlorite dismutase
MTTFRPSAEPVSKGPRQYLRYACYKLQPEWRRLPAAEKDTGKRELAAVIHEFSDRMIIHPYSVMGTRADADFFLWEVAQKLEEFQTLATRIHSTGLGRYLDLRHSFLSMTNRSIYVDRHEHPGSESTRLKVTPVNTKYLFVYPFVKTREWYLLPKERRQEMMNTHIAIGHKYPTVKINTSYSFGLDDQDFVVAFESDFPGDFLDLVMDLRETEASRYTVRDTPILTGVAMSIEECLDTLGA